MNLPRSHADESNATRFVFVRVRPAARLQSIRGNRPKFCVTAARSTCPTKIATRGIAFIGTVDCMVQVRMWEQERAGVYSVLVLFFCSRTLLLPRMRNNGALDFANIPRFGDLRRRKDAIRRGEVGRQGPLAFLGLSAGPTALVASMRQTNNLMLRVRVRLKVLVLIRKGNWANGDRRV